jgi:hypothetical protein
MRVSRVERSRRRSSERSCEGGGGVVIGVIGVMVEEGFGKYLLSKLDTEGIERVMGSG